ncbi:FMN-binding protein [Demequina lutea]|uniref:Uncharacterized protein with FMN-binding domain n=1 Tax=Demequina lutea TaxID=431489 RepID=A0A7Y9ZBM5_9MICO|nr:FMN-binding protein [Demequina lutea]NYI41870.1 uncharacterized protein with FMN-binding domain [Demequina lutea]
MKTGRSVALVAASTSMLIGGWAAGNGLTSATSGTASASGTNLGASAQGTSGAASSSAGASSSSAASAPTTSAAAASGKFDSSPVGTRYGTFQVELTVAAGKITDISMLQSGAQDGTSRQITGYALPMLIKAVLQKQTANVGYVSGASYTTQGFEGAVQSAMKAAGLA